MNVFFNCLWVCILELELVKSSLLNCFGCVLPTPILSRFRASRGKGSALVCLLVHLIAGVTRVWGSPFGLLCAFVPCCDLRVFFVVILTERLL